MNGVLTRKPESELATPLYPAFFKEVDILLNNKVNNIDFLNYVT